MNGRPRLKSHMQPLRRGPGSLQLGLRPDTGVVLDGLSDAEIAMVEGLDGSLDIRSLYAVAADAGIAAGRMSALIAALDEHHLLVGTTTDRACLAPVDEPRRHLLRQDARAVAEAYGLSGDGSEQVAARSRRHVLISGEGDLPCALADLLRVGGIGRVSVGPHAVNMLDLELRNQPAARDRARSGSTLKRPDLVVLMAMGAIRPDAGAPWLRRGIPHLPLVVQGHRVQVGPVIAVGPGPCLTCLDLHRRDRDAAWPAVLSQLVPREPLLPAAPVSLESTLTAMTAGAAAMIVHTCLDGQPVPSGLSLELSLSWPTIQLRRWFSHPLCNCTAEQETMTG
ncbi:MAG: hypothetical protein ABIP19_04705 [Dermatophilaceae bacterium]